jgi:hypothetical protein
MHDVHDIQDGSFTDTIDIAESIRFSSMLMTSATAGFQSAELYTIQYVPNRIDIIDDGPGLLAEQAINWIRATKDIQLQNIDANLSDSLKQAEQFANICNHNESLAGKVKDWEAAGPVQDSPSRELVAAQQEIEDLGEELQIEKNRSAKLERQLNICTSEPETME